MSTTTSDRLVERERNRLLRRVDWRFLLPQSRPTRSVCFVPGLLAEGVAAISGEFVRPPVAAASCDLAVAVDPDQATLAAAWSALMPGGVCYTEWYSPLSLGLRGVRRRLAAAGFEQPRCFWPWPWPTAGSALFWLPVEDRLALRFFLAQRPPAPGALRQLARTLVQSVWRGASAVGATLPVCAVARKPERTSVAGGASSESYILATVRRTWSEWCPEPEPRRLSLLLLTGGPRSISKVVGLVFADDQPQPQLVVKLPRVPEATSPLKQEAVSLEHVHQMRPGGIPGVPRLLFRHSQQEQFMLGQTALSGVPLWTRLRGDTYHALALQATTWQAALAAGAAIMPREEWWGRLGAPILERFRTMFSPVLDRGILREAEQVIATLGALPQVCEQRDFSPWNVLLDPDGALIVLDWESAEPQGLPALDLIYFLTFLAFFLDGTMHSGRERGSYRQTRKPLTRMGAVTEACLVQYCRQVGLATGALRPLRLLTWMLHARSEYLQFSSDIVGRPGPTELRRSVFMALWEEELRLCVEEA